MQHSHKAGSLKQVNKTHKQSKASKRSIKLKQGGRVEAAEKLILKEKIQNHKVRANVSRQIRENKRKQFLEKRRTGAGSAFPSIVALVPIGENVDTRSVLKQILSICSDCPIRYSSLGIDGIAQPVTIVLPKNKSRLTFVCCTQNLENVLDTCKVADLCVFVCNTANGEENVVNPQADLILTSLRSQGLPTSVGLIQGLESISNPKIKTNMKKYATRLFQTEFNPDIKVFDDNHVDQLLRCLSDVSCQPLHWRQMRSYLLAEDVEVLPKSIEQAGFDLVIRGYIHGSPLCVYDLIHITGEGTHQMKSIRVLPDPSPLKKTHGEAEGGFETIIADPSRLQSLDEECEVDPSTVQQPQWQIPANFEENGTITNTEAIWREVVGDDLYEDEEDRRRHEELMALDEEDNLSDNMSDQEFLDVEDAEEYNRRYGRQNKQILTEEERKQEEEEYWEAPDFVDVPLDQPARYRYIKYRGLQSFRSSPWDPKENLPIEYSTLYQFEDYFGLVRTTLQQHETRLQCDGDWVYQNMDGSEGHDRVLEAGSFVEIVVMNVSNAWVSQRMASQPLLLSSLLPHEEKLTVMHSSIQRSSTWYPQTVRSRDLLVAHIGFRHFLIHPLFADPALKCDKSKYIKYVPPTGFFNCSFYAPLCYRPSPMLLFKPRTQMNQDLQLVGIGSINKSSTDDIILKKIILTGNPFKVRRKLATVRHMFYDPKDILWFKPVELHTKLGSVGHIREPLGTHGYMKCIFNEQVTMQDEVRLALYKRVYPHKCTDEEKSSFI